MLENKDILKNLTKRYGNIEEKALESVLCPALIPIKKLDKSVFKITGQKHYRATFELEITKENDHLMQRGRTGKFVPNSYINGGPWREIAKGRLYDFDERKGVAHGEIYIGSSSSKRELEKAIENLNEDDFLEIDQFGASAKVLSSLSEYYLAEHARSHGYKVRRMPEDMARHLGSYYNYDFEVTKNNKTLKVELKSLWGTDTRYARLIHSQNKDYPTSSCKFETQDIFAVSLFFRTGNIRDFAFARSISQEESVHGLPSAKKYPNHVNQNPICTIGNGVWFETLDEVWDLT